MQTYVQLVLAMLFYGVSFVSTKIVLVALPPLTVLVISFLYRWVTIASGSATLGMRMMSIEFRTRYGERFDGGTALLHTLGYTVSVAVSPAAR